MYMLQFLRKFSHRSQKRKRKKKKIRESFSKFPQVVTRAFVFIQAVVLLDLADSGGESAAADLSNEFGKDRAIFIVCDVSKSEQLKGA